MKLSKDSSRVAVYHNEIHYLSKYLGGRNLDLSNYLPWFFQWNESGDILDRAGVDQGELEELAEEGDDKLYEVCDQILKVMSDQEKEEFAGYIAQDNPTDAPAWAHLSLKNKRLPRNTWLVHFSDQTGKITEEGFTRGVSEMDEIALTTHLHDNTKRYGGYNFAFIAGDKYSQSAARTGKYGGSAVMFQSSGLEIYHYGDEENQVIFWGHAINPASIVELVLSEKGWAVAARYRSPMHQKGREYAYEGEFADVVSWVKSHWFQYRKQIMGR